MTSFVRAVRIGLGCLGLFAVGYQFVARSMVPPFNPVDYFSYFTILSNIFFALGIIFSGVFERNHHAGWQMIRGASIVYMLVTGVVYTLLLRGLEESLHTSIPWVNAILHYVMPCVALVDWRIHRPSRPIRWSALGIWLIFPLIYLLYSLIRGPLTGFYPYPFLNVERLGYPTVFLFCGMILIGMIGASLIVLVMSRQKVYKQR